MFTRALLPLLAFCVIARGADFDLIIRAGTIIDGTGAPGRVADLAVKDGRIVAVGTARGTATQNFDATGLVVAPGFIDVHTHAEDILALPRAENFVRMGVTTLVMGNCGSSATNVGAYFQRLEKKQISANVATLFGHGTARRRAMHGSFDRPPTTNELAIMKEMVRRAMEDGALGLSTGLIYLPGTFSKTEEIVELASVAAQYGGLYASHMRSESAEIFAALDEVFRIGREAHLPVHVSHIKLSGRSNWGQADKALAAIDKARAEGVHVTQDQYAYTASSTSLATLIPRAYREGGRFESRISDPEIHDRIVAEMKEPRARSGGDYSYAVIASYRENPKLNGLNVAEAALKLRGSNSLDAQIETILDIQSHGSASAVFHSMNEKDLQTFMQHSNTMFACDSGVRRLNSGVPHPRGYGNNARILARYVRELHQLPLEEAVRRMTSLPASTFGLTNRGVLVPGAWADLVVFDPAKVQDNSTFKDPHHYATGFSRAYVNGVAVVKDDKHTGALPGRPIRRGDS